MTREEVFEKLLINSEVYSALIEAQLYLEENIKETERLQAEVCHLQLLNEVEYFALGDEYELANIIELCLTGK
jgi:hypothetical protein